MTAVAVGGDGTELGERRRVGELLIEAGRLRGELTATQELVRLMAGEADPQAVLEAVAVLTGRLVGTGRAAVHVLDGDRLAQRATIGERDGRLWLASPHAGGLRSRPVDAAPEEEWKVTLPDMVGPALARQLAGEPLDPGWVAARAVLERRTVAVADLFGPGGDDFPHSRAMASAFRARGGTGYAGVASTPLLRGGQPLGVLTALSTSPHGFTPGEIALLETFAAQAALALENARLFSELQGSNATLKESLEQQTATADVLKVIAGSPGDLGHVLAVLCESAARLCDGTGATVWLRREGRLYRLGSWAAPGEPTRAQQAADLSPTHGAGWAVLHGRTLHLPDLAAEPDVPGLSPEWRERMRGSGAESMLLAPLLRGGEAVGCLVVRRPKARAFSERQIELLESFADQAVVAIENTRLFGELRERDERRRQELERASMIQQRLLPERVEGWPGVLEVAVRFRPAVETSGDFYDVLRLTPSGEGALPPLQVAVGDVAGKGMSAALVTALARSALHATASVPTRMATPSGTLREAGARLYRDVGGGHFVACALAVVEPPGLHHAGPLLRLANAAQVPVLLVRGGAAVEVEPGGYRLPLGAQADGGYEDAKVELGPGDVVVFSSDGLVEAPAIAAAAVPSHLRGPERAGELFGFARLEASTSYWAQQASSAEEAARGIWGDLTAWCGEESHHDDVTLLVLRVPGSSPAGPV